MRFYRGQHRAVDGGGVMADRIFRAGRFGLSDLNLKKEVKLLKCETLLKFNTLYLFRFTIKLFLIGIFE